MTGAISFIRKQATPFCKKALLLLLWGVCLTIIIFLWLFLAIMKAATTSSRGNTGDSTHVSSLAEFRELILSLLPPFEGNETEDNWKLRDRTLTTLRRITNGNAPTDFHAEYVSSMRTMSDGFAKSVSSLRTSLACNGFSVLQLVFGTVGADLDSILDIVLIPLIKQCSSAKNLYSTAAEKTVTCVLTHANFHPRFVSYILDASRDRNAKPRACALGWLVVLFTVYAFKKNVFEHGNLLETIIQVIQRGLADADANVRDAARKAFHTFKPLWPAHAEAIENALRPAQRNLLQEHAEQSRNRAARDAGSTSRQGSRRPATNTTQPEKRPSIRDAMQASRRARAEAGQAAQPEPEPVLETPTQAPEAPIQAPISQQPPISSLMANGPRRPRPIRAGTAGTRPRTPDITAPVEHIPPQAPEIEAPIEHIQSRPTTIPAEPADNQTETVENPAESSENQAEPAANPAVDTVIQAEPAPNPPQEAETRPQEAGRLRQHPLKDVDALANLAGTKKLILGHLDDIGTLKKLARRLDSSITDGSSLKRVQIAQIGSVLAESIASCRDSNSAIMHKQIEVLRTAVDRYRDQTATVIADTAEAILGLKSRDGTTARNRRVLGEHHTFFLGNVDPAEQRASVLKLIDQVRRNDTTTSSASTTPKSKTTSVEASVEAWTALLESGSHVDAAVGSQLLHLLRSGLLSGEGKRLWIELGVSLHAVLDQGAFWKELQGVGDSEKSLLLYYLAKRGGQPE